MGKRPTDVAAQLKALKGADRNALKALWVECFGAPLRFRGHCDLLRLILAYRLQESIEGGLSKAARGRLRQVVDQSAQRKARPAPTASQVKPGTRLIREWRGGTHIVSVLHDAVEYRGKRYGSLSEVARTITGTRWSGPAFFGLRPATAAPEQHGSTA